MSNSHSIPHIYLPNASATKKERVATVYRKQAIDIHIIVVDHVPEIQMPSALLSRLLIS